jgi:urea transporter
MAALSAQPLVARGRSALDHLAASFAHIVFSRRRAVGLLILCAAATEPRCLLFGLCALLAAEGAVRALRLKNVYAPYGYNALLCGIAIAREYTGTPAAFGFAVALGVSSVLVTAALGALAGYVGFIPVLSIPFVVTSWLAIGVAQHLPLLGVAPVIDTWATGLPPLLALTLQSFGGFLLLPNVLAGAFVLAALSLHSRISMLLATSAALLVLVLLQFTQAPLAEAMLQGIACSAALAAVTVGGLWLVPSRGSSLVALGTALLAAFFALGLAAPLTRLGLSLSFVPFNAAAILVLSALRERAANHGPRLADFAADTPEQSLLNHVAQQPHADAGLRLHLPFYGAWACTQGVDGAYTHRGILRHAYDFEMYGGSDSALCGSAGSRVEDYHCFGQPVLAAADGTVVAVESYVPNNAVGEDNSQKPWGNYVTLQHAGSVYSLVAHLAPGSVVVYPGQFVPRGTVLGYCGNSGRSPRPHLHFQLQTTAQLGSPTLPCRFSDVVVRRSGGTHFESAHAVEQGEVLQTLQPDYALGAHFELPLGATLTYRVGGQLERVVSEIDGWGRCVLRSIDRDAELVFARSETCFSFRELRGTPDSVLTLLRLALSHVPLERHPELTFRSTLPERWLGGRLRGLAWDLKAPFKSAHGIALHSRVEVSHRGLTVVGASTILGVNGEPLIQTRAVFGGAVGPRLLEVSAFGREQRAELVVNTTPTRRVASESSGPASLFPIGVGDWS